jgi:hypothetical protein
MAMNRLTPFTCRIRGWTYILMTLLGLPAAMCFAGDQVPFKASFHGFAQAPVHIEGSVFKVIVPLSGHGTHLGDFDEQLTHFIDFSTLEFTGFAVFTAANGDTFHTEFSGQLFPTDDADWLSFEVTHIIVGGTGRFAGATGILHGVNGRFNTVTGEDVGGYIGTISSPGSAKGR